MTRTFKNFQDYIASLAAAHKKVLHGTGGRKSFFRMATEEDIASISGKIASPMVIIAGIAGQIREFTSLQYAARIYFLSHVPESKINSADEIEKAQEEAFGVMMDFWTRIQKEFEDEGQCAFTEDLQSPNFQPIGPVNQFEVGWELTIRFGVEGPEYDEDNWN
jgi:hypothetical protein